MARIKNNAARRRDRKTRVSGTFHSSRFTGPMAAVPTVSSDLLCTRRFEVILDAATSEFTTSTKAIIDTLPGGSALWDSVRFDRFDVFGFENWDEAGDGRVYTDLAVTLHGVVTGSSDTPTGFCDGVGFVRRAHVGIIPDSLFQQTWVPTSNTDPLLTIRCHYGDVNRPTGKAIVQFVATVRSTATYPEVPSMEATARSRTAQ